MCEVAVLVVVVLQVHAGRVASSSAGIREKVIREGCSRSG